MEENTPERTEQEIRKEISLNESQTINEVTKTIDMACTAIILLPLVQIYLRSGEPDPISDTARLKTLSKAIDRLISKQTLPELNRVIYKRSLTSWKLGEVLCSASLIGRVPESVLKELKEAGTFAHREQAAKEFLNRKIKGITLSKRVWNLQETLKTQIETTLQLAVFDGKSAMQTATTLKQYLKNPDALFRRTRDISGKLQLSKAAKLYTPGTGVYRSAYKNASRLARNEINNAYRRADWQQFQSLDFVTGYHIQLSNNHPVTDICDTLTGLYPKTFQWCGWHVQCRCHMIKEIVGIDQFAKYQEGSFIPQQTTEYPGMMKEWITENRSRFKRAAGTGVDWIDNNPQLLSIFKNTAQKTKSNI